MSQLILQTRREAVLLAMFGKTMAQTAPTAEVIHLMREWELTKRMVVFPSRTLGRCNAIGVCVRICTFLQKNIFTKLHASVRVTKASRK